LKARDGRLETPEGDHRGVEGIYETLKKRNFHGKYKFPPRKTKKRNREKGFRDAAPGEGIKRRAINVWSNEGGKRQVTTKRREEKK